MNQLTTTQIITHMKACEAACEKRIDNPEYVFTRGELEKLYTENKRQLAIIDNVDFDESTLKGISRTAKAIIESLQSYKSFLYSAMPKELRAELDPQLPRPNSP